MKKIAALVLSACMLLGLCACSPAQNGFVKLDMEAIGKGAGLNSIDVYGDEALVLTYSYGEEIEEPYNLSVWSLKRNKLLRELDFKPEGDYGCSAAFDEDGMIVVTEWRGEGREVTTAYDRELNKLDNYVPKKAHPEDKYNALGVTDYWQGDNYAYYDVGSMHTMIFYDQPDRVYFTDTGTSYSAAEDGMRIVFCHETEGRKYYDMADYSKGGMINHATLATKRAGYYDAYTGDSRMNEKYVITSLSFEEEHEYSEPEEPEYSSETIESTEEISSSDESSESSEEISSSEEADSESGSSDVSASSEEPASSEPEDDGESSADESEESSADEPQPDALEEEVEDTDCDCGYDGEYYDEDVNTYTEIWFWDYTVGASETADSNEIYYMTLDEIERKTKERAQQMSDKYGLSIVVNPDYGVSEGMELISNDTFVPAYLNLDTLDETLGAFPSGIFDEMRDGGSFDEFRLCIGKSIDDDFSAAYSTNMDGVLYVVLSTSSFNMSNISHEMMHAMEYRLRDIWNDWRKLNPRGFEYYGDLREANNSDYDSNYFVRGYGQSNQLEDRATIFEELFVSGSEGGADWWYADKPGVVAKAKFLCDEIRKAYPSVAAVDEAVWEVPLESVGR